MPLVLANLEHTDFNPKGKWKFALGWNYGLWFGSDAFSRCYRKALVIFNKWVYCFKDAWLANTRWQKWVGSFLQRGQGLKKYGIPNTGEITGQNVKHFPHNLILLEAVWTKHFCTFKWLPLSCRSGGGNGNPLQYPWVWTEGRTVALGFDKYLLHPSLNK